jgi:hypothetical protein
MAALKASLGEAGVKKPARRAPREEAAKATPIKAAAAKGGRSAAKPRAAAGKR